MHLFVFYFAVVVVEENGTIKIKVCASSMHLCVDMCIRTYVFIKYIATSVCIN